MLLPLDRHPLILAIAGPNGAGKSTFYELHVSAAGLHFVKAHWIARALQVDAYAAASMAAATRERLVERRESFLFEMVFSDPAGDKLDFLRWAIEVGHNVILCSSALRAPTFQKIVWLCASPGAGMMFLPTKFKRASTHAEKPEAGAD